MEETAVDITKLSALANRLHPRFASRKSLRVTTWLVWSQPLFQRL